MFSPWQMGPSSEKKYVSWDKWTQILLNKHGFLMFPQCPRQSMSLGELWAHLQVPQGKHQAPIPFSLENLPQPILLLKATWPRKSGQVACPNTNLFSR